MRKVCVVSSNRADYGLLYWPMRMLQQQAEFDLQVVVTGSHLSPEHGLSVERFAADGFDVDGRVDLALNDDSAIAVTQSMGAGLIGFSEVFSELKPDLLMVLGDRYEILAVVTAALIAKIPVAHLFGGDMTEGAFDESIRHAITKMSHIHFVSNAVSAKRVRQMGENPRHIYNVGATSIDNICRASYKTRDEFFALIGFEPRRYNLLITFHPVTLDSASSVDLLQQLLTALTALGDDYGLIFTKANADTEGNCLNELIKKFVEDRNNAQLYDALGDLYVSALKHVDVVVGNSSSGLYEAPAFGVPTVNIGDRQKGRLQAVSISNCDVRHEAILNAIQSVVGKRYNKVDHPYGDGHSSEKIIAALKRIPDFNVLLQKHFFMMTE